MDNLQVSNGFMKWNVHFFVKDIMVNTQTLAAATQILDQSAVNQGNPLQQSHTRILSPYKTYS
jgi:hypothetical protein